MIDPLAQVVTLLQPSARFSKVAVAAGRWRVHRSDAGQPFYGVVLEGRCRLAIEGREAIELQSSDFILIPAAYRFALSSLEQPAIDTSDIPVALGPGLFRLGAQEGPTDLRMLVGHCNFGSPDATLLVSLLPELVHVRGEPRLSTLVKLVSEESLEQRPAREVVLARLLEVIFIEALRTTAGTTATPGLVRGLADERLAIAIRRMHENPATPWTVAQLAKESALSRSAFFERFRRALGVAPMEYLLAWRMALAKKLLLQGEDNVAKVAEHVGYNSATTFSAAFARHVGQPPTRYARMHKVSVTANGSSNPML